MRVEGRGMRERDVVKELKGEGRRESHRERDLGRGYRRERVEGRRM